MKCPYCKEEIMDGNRTCPICGEKIIVMSKTLKIFLILLHIEFLYFIVMGYNNFLVHWMLRYESILHFYSVLIDLLPIFSILLYWFNHVLRRKTNFHLLNENKFLTGVLHIIAIDCIYSIRCLLTYTLKGGELNSITIIHWLLFGIPVLILTAWYWKEKLTVKK